MPADQLNLLDLLDGDPPPPVASPRPSRRRTSSGPEPVDPTVGLAGWRVHHNVVGYLLVAAGLVRTPRVLIPMGIGMIVGHRRRDRLWWFLERVG